MHTFGPADILLPKDADMTKWSVVACDQYTSEPEYWEKAEKIAKDAPSTLNITFPEVYLEKGDPRDRIESINKTMEEYLPIFKEYKSSVIYLKRTMADGRVRHGIVGIIDLEQYDYNKGSNAMIRATEGTVLERIPPRVKIRENAVLELPHVMLLIDDREKTVIEPLYNKKDSKVYDFDLMLGGGHAEGYLLSKEEVNSVLAALDKLADADEFNKKYNTVGQSPMLFAVGDGNHSLATAKACYENIKKTLSPKEAENHPARYALCEVVNLHDEALDFKAIHRVVFSCKPKKLICELEKFYSEGDSHFAPQKIDYYFEGEEGTVTLQHPTSPLEIANLQKFLDEYLKQNPNAKVDYIHGEDVTKRLGTLKDNIGFILPDMSKNALFETVIADGVLPRKTFSMGEAHEKRFYIECRKIK